MTPSNQIVPAVDEPSNVLQLTKEMAEEENERLLPPVLLQYWHTMLRWRMVLLGIIGASVAIGVIATMLMAPLYTSKAEIEISRQQKKVTNVAGLNADEQPQDLEFYATQYALLKATSLAERVAKSLKLADNPDFYAAHGKSMPEGPDRRQRLVVKLLLDNVAIDPVRTSRLVDVSYTSRSAALSAQIANAWVREFIGATTDREYDSTSQARQFLESRLETLRQKMEISEQNTVNFASRNNIVTLEVSRDASGKTEAQKTLTAADLEQLNLALLNARSDRITAEARAHSGSAEVSSELLANSAVGAMKAQRAEASAEYAKLLTQFDPGYPAARAMKHQIDELDRSIAKETVRFNAERQQSYRQALAREQDLEAQVNVAKSMLDKQNHASIQYNIYQRDADTNRQLYDGLLQRYKEIAEAGAVGASNIAVVDMAKISNSPSAPKLLVNIALSFLLGIGLASVAVLVLEQIDEGIRGPEDVWNLLKLPLLGNVPLSGGAPLEALSDPKSAVTEAYLSIRSNLAFSTNHGLPRTLAFTSTVPNEGKSTTAVALAEIIGRTGRSVILVDADLRNPSIHKMLALENNFGLSNMLTGEENLLGFVRKSERRGLSLLTAGPLPPNPAELLSNECFSDIVALLAGHFDHVVIDCPPVLGLADAPLICRAVEGCVFVSEPGRAPLRGIRSGLQRLKFAGTKIFGVIVTKIDVKKQHYGYSYGYGYGYGYGSYKYEEIS